MEVIIDGVRFVPEKTEQFEVGDRVLIIGPAINGWRTHISDVVRGIDEAEGGEYAIHVFGMYRSWFPASSLELVNR